MKHEQLWAPWRLAYITGAEKPAKTPPDHELHWEPGADRECFLCRDVADDSPVVDRENLVVRRTPRAIVVLNRYPYNNGHVLIAPRRHVPRLDQLADEEHLELMRMISQVCVAQERLMNAEGFNIGLNLGRVAGAGLPGHIHWHVVPRWNGDTNFMPALAGVKVISQSLEALFDLLHEALK